MNLHRKEHSTASIGEYFNLILQNYPWVDENNLNNIIKTLHNYSSEKEKQTLDYFKELFNNKNIEYNDEQKTAFQTWLYSESSEAMDNKSIDFGESINNLIKNVEEPFNKRTPEKKRTLTKKFIINMANQFKHWPIRIRHNSLENLLQLFINQSEIKEKVKEDEKNIAPLASEHFTNLIAFTEKITIKKIVNDNSISITPEHNQSISMLLAKELERYYLYLNAEGHKKKAPDIFKGGLSKRLQLHLVNGIQDEAFEQSHQDAFYKNILKINNIFDLLELVAYSGDIAEQRLDELMNSYLVYLKDNYDGSSDDPLIFLSLFSKVKGESLRSKFHAMVEQVINKKLLSENQWNDQTNKGLKPYQQHILNSPDAIKFLRSKFPSAVSIYASPEIKVNAFIALITETQPKDTTEHNEKVKEAYYKFSMAAEGEKQTCAELMIEGMININLNDFTDKHKIYIMNRLIEIYNGNKEHLDGTYIEKVASKYENFLNNIFQQGQASKNIYSDLSLVFRQYKAWLPSFDISDHLSKVEHVANPNLFYSLCADFGDEKLKINKLNHLLDTIYDQCITKPPADKDFSLIDEISRISALFRGKISENNYIDIMSKFVNKFIGHDSIEGAKLLYNELPNINEYIRLETSIQLFTKINEKTIVPFNLHVFIIDMSLYSQSMPEENQQEFTNEIAKWFYNKIPQQLPLQAFELLECMSYLPADEATQKRLLPDGDLTHTCAAIQKAAPYSLLTIIETITVNHLGGDLFQGLQNIKRVMHRTNNSEIVSTEAMMCILCNNLLGKDLSDEQKKSVQQYLQQQQLQLILSYLYKPHAHIALPGDYRSLLTSAFNAIQSMPDINTIGLGNIESLCDGLEYYMTEHAYRSEHIDMIRDLYTKVDDNVSPHISRRTQQIKQQDSQQVHSRKSDRTKIAPHHKRKETKTEPLTIGEKITKFLKRLTRLQSTIERLGSLFTVNKRVSNKNKSSPHVPSNTAVNINSVYTRKIDSAPISQCIDLSDRLVNYTFDERIETTLFNKLTDSIANLKSTEIKNPKIKQLHQKITLLNATYKDNKYLTIINGMLNKFNQKEKDIHEGMLSNFLSSMRSDTKTISLDKQQLLAIQKTTSREQKNSYRNEIKQLISTLPVNSLLSSYLEKLSDLLDPDATRMDSSDIEQLITNLATISESSLHKNQLSTYKMTQELSEESIANQSSKIDLVKSFNEKQIEIKSFYQPYHSSSMTPFADEDIKLNAIKSLFENKSISTQVAARLTTKKNKLIVKLNEIAKLLKIPFKNDEPVSFTDILQQCIENSYFEIIDYLYSRDFDLDLIESNLLQENEMEIKKVAIAESRDKYSIDRLLNRDPEVNVQAEINHFLSIGALHVVDHILTAHHSILLSSAQAANYKLVQDYEYYLTKIKGNSNENINTQDAGFILLNFSSMPLIYRSNYIDQIQQELKQTFQDIEENKKILSGGDRYKKIDLERLKSLYILYQGLPDGIKDDKQLAQSKDKLVASLDDTIIDTLNSHNPNSFIQCVSSNSDRVSLLSNQIATLMTLLELTEPEKSSLTKQSVINKLKFSYINSILDCFTHITEDKRRESLHLVHMNYFRLFKDIDPTYSLSNLHLDAISGYENPAVIKSYLTLYNLDTQRAEALHQHANRHKSLSDPSDELKHKLQQIFDQVISNIEREQSNLSNEISAIQCAKDSDSIEKMIDCIKNRSEVFNDTKANQYIENFYELKDSYSSNYEALHRHALTTQAKQSPIDKIKTQLQKIMDKIIYKLKSQGRNNTQTITQLHQALLSNNIETMMASIKDEHTSALFKDTQAENYIEQYVQLKENDFSTHSKILNYRTRCANAIYVDNPY